MLAESAVLHEFVIWAERLAGSARAHGVDTDVNVRPATSNPSVTVDFEAASAFGRITLWSDSTYYLEAIDSTTSATILSRHGMLADQAFDDEFCDLCGLLPNWLSEIALPCASPRRSEATRGSVVEEWPAEPIINLLNAIYYRRFADEHAEAVISYYNAIDFDKLSADPLRIAEISAVPFLIMADLESYREGNPIGSQYTAEQEVYRLQKLARRLHDFIMAKLASRETELSWDA